MRQLHSALWCCSVLALCGFGCASAPTQTASILTEAVEQLSGGKVDADIAAQQMVFTDTKTGDLMAFGERVVLPEAFPDDAPLYASSTIVGVTISALHDKGASLTLRSDDAPAKVLAWYAETLRQKGFREVSRSTAGGTELRKYSKDGVSLALTIAATGIDKSTSLVTVIRTKE